MFPARKMNACACATQTSALCEGCGTPVTRDCSMQEIVSRDLRTVAISTFCPACKEDPKINTWGTLYWDTLVGLYT